ncbi:MAG: Ig-like domain-containing protein [Desulfuromonadales bacterium]|nr:Ig-like domain-containing protein [Desulfuromonadales bacterium]MDW7758387.1 Ig-like domain-containing protein [Desulfuromonadales bacterium]
MNIRINGVLLLLGAILLGGCGGSGGDSSMSGDPASLPDLSASATLLEGRVADGYLRNALVFLDRNGNKRHDADEPATRSGEQGYYSLSVAQGDGERYPVVVQVRAGETIDEDNIEEPVAFHVTLEAPAGHHGFISPLSTLIKHELEKFPQMAAPEAEVHVRNALNLSEDLSLLEDYVALSLSSADADRRAAAVKAHNTARVLTRLMGALLAEMEVLFAGDIPATQYDAALLVASSAILEEKSRLVEGMNDITQGLTQAEAEALATELLSHIPMEQVDMDRVALYDQRLLEKNEVWDVTPPTHSSLMPQIGQTVPVNTPISLVLSEDIDESSLTDDSIQLQSSAGLVPGTLTYDAPSRRLTFQPSQPLFAYTRYTARLNPGLTDRFGNALTDTFSWEFETLFNIAPPAPPVF